VAHVVKLAQQIAPSDASVLITGESGTGKEVVARYVHNRSNRARAPFISVNCAAIPENLLESELFGHEKGAFTGAVARRIGKFEEATGGTLLLDEISEMDVPPAGQAAARHPGTRDRPRRRHTAGAGRHPHHRDLEPQPGRGRARGHLPRGSAVPPQRGEPQNPPLRERPADVIELAQYFIKKYADANGVPVRPLSAEARRTLVAQPLARQRAGSSRTPSTAPCCSRSADEIGIDGILTPDGMRLDQAKNPPAVAHATLAAETVTRALVGRTVARSSAT